MNGSLVWVDLEMTGLDPSCHVILEIAVVITDGTLSAVHPGPNLVIHNPETALSGMDVVVQSMHQSSGLLDRVRDSQCTLEQATQAVIEFVRERVPYKKGMLAGNSVWKDREFLCCYMKPLIDYLDYRMIDVSTLKELIRYWYPERRDMVIKKEKHRALDDITESIEELRRYKQDFFV